MDASTAEYYDAFGGTFLRDIICGNRRVQAVHQFLRQAIPRDTERILLVGCGAGRDAWELARRVAPTATILAVDISENNIRLATTLYSHPHVTYRHVDILDGPVGDAWQYIVLPDVYEHIPRPRRVDLHEMFRRSLTNDGRILLTCPTPWYQQMLRERGSGLQIVDEDVTLGDIEAIANHVGGFLSLYRTVSIWNANDYFHAIVERRTGIYPLDSTNHIPIKGYTATSFVNRTCSAFCVHSGLRGLLRLLRAWRIKRKLRDTKEPSDHAAEDD